MDDGFAIVSVPADATFQAPLLRYVKGLYLLGAEREEVEIGTQIIAHAISEGWVKLVKGEPAVRICREAGQPFPKRHELSDTDETQWPLFDGKPSDPWVITNDIYMTRCSDGRAMIFTTHSFTGRQAAVELARQVVYKRRACGQEVKPIIELGSGTWMSRRGPIAIPKLTIVDWVDADVTSVTPAIAPEAAPAPLAQVLAAKLAAPREPIPQPRRRGEPAAKPTQSLQKELDDEIPW